MQDSLQTSSGGYFESAATLSWHTLLTTTVCNIYVYLLSCWDLEEEIDTILMSLVNMKLLPAAGQLSTKTGHGETASLALSKANKI